MQPLLNTKNKSTYPNQLKIELNQIILKTFASKGQSKNTKPWADY